ncbi:hypothetical protein [Bradyrhizobium sp. UFLA05-112]
MDESLRVRKATPVDWFLIGLFLYGAYSTISVFGGDGKILFPNVLCLVAAIGMAARTAQFYSARVIVAIAIIFVIGLANFACHAISSFEDSLEIAKSCLQIVYSIAISYSMFVFLSTLPAALVRRLFLMCALALVIGAVLEIYAGLGSISDAFRALVFPKGLYVNDQRDEILYGQTRPKVFSLEPSFVGLWFTVFLSAWFSLAQRNTFVRDSLVSAFICIPALLVIRSPTILFFCLVWASAGMFLFSPLTELNRFADRHLRRVALACSISALCLLSVFVSLAAESRDYPLLSGESVFIRLIAPLEIAEYTVTELPMAGFGLGAQDALTPYVLSYVQSRRERVNGTWDEATSARSLLTNSFFQHWIFLGIGFGVLMILGYQNLLRALRVKQISYIYLSTSVMWFTVGGYVTVPPWAIFFLFVTVAALHQRRALQVQHSKRAVKIAARSGSNEMSVLKN